MKITQNLARALLLNHGIGSMPKMESTELTTPVFIGEKIYFQTMPIMASDGTEKKKNKERTKLQPMNFLLSTTANGIARQVTPTITMTAYRMVKPSPCKVDESENTFL